MGWVGLYDILLMLNVLLALVPSPLLPPKRLQATCLHSPLPLRCWQKALAAEVGPLEPTPWRLLRPKARWSVVQDAMVATSRDAFGRGWNKCPGQGVGGWLDSMCAVAGGEHQRGLVWLPRILSLVGDGVLDLPRSNPAELLLASYVHRLLQLSPFWHSTW